MVIRVRAWTSPTESRARSYSVTKSVGVSLMHYVKTGELPKDLKLCEQIKNLVSGEVGKYPNDKDLRQAIVAIWVQNNCELDELATVEIVLY